jgi:N-formylglutamate amidohydrolase
MKPFFISIPHSGERVPREAAWLQGLAEPVLMCDVDRYVDQLYAPIVSELKLKLVKTEWHRYVVDLNRLPDDVDAASVVGSPHPAGTFTTGLHWVKTTRGAVLMPHPISKELHEQLVRDYFEPFHEAVRRTYSEFRGQGAGEVFHIDAHSMPSKGTSAHRDPGETRAEIVVSDSKGKSCSAEFKDLVIEAYTKAGLQVAYNWPYFGGRVTETYGHPEKGQQALQVEINRALYMDEETKQLIPEKAKALSEKLARAIREVRSRLPDI